MADVKNEFDDIMQILTDTTSDSRLKQRRGKRQAEAKYQHYRDGAGELATNAKEQANQLLEAGKVGANQLYTSGKETVSDLSDTASEVSDKVSSYWDRHGNHIFNIAIALLGIKLIRNLRKLMQD